MICKCALPRLTLAALGASKRLVQVSAAVWPGEDGILPGLCNSDHNTDEFSYSDATILPKDCKPCVVM